VADGKDPKLFGMSHHVMRQRILISELNETLKKKGNIDIIDEFIRDQEEIEELKPDLLVEGNIKR